MPGLLVWPKRLPEPRVVSAPCSTSDYLPTILSALDIELGPTQQRPLDGVDLLPLLEGRTSARPGPIAFESKRQLALIDNRYKLYSKDRGESFELYDLETDPSEHEGHRAEPSGATRQHARCANDLA